jgi:hypothetical protein
MSTHPSGGRSISVRRIALLVTCGVLMGLAWTDAGRNLTWRAALASVKPDVRVPLRMEFAYGPALRFDALERAFHDVAAPADPDQRHALPTPELVASRLSGIDGWSTAVLCEFGSDAGALHRAGLDNALVCTELARWNGTDVRSWIFASGPLRYWRLVLLDGKDRQVGAFDVSAFRGGFALREFKGEMAYVVSPGEPGDGPLPAVCVFRRNEAGEVRPG